MFYFVFLPDSGLYLAVYIPLQCEHLYRHLADYLSLLVRTVLAEDALFTATFLIKTLFSSCTSTI